MGNNNFEMIASCLISQERQLTEYALRLSANDPSAAKDLYQETACRALLNADKYTGIGHPEAWLRTIMRNTFLNEQTCAYNSRKIRAEMTEIHISDPSLSPDDAVAIREIADAIGQFKQERDRTLMIRWIQGYTYAEMAEELGMKQGTVKSALFRLIRLLRSQLK